MVKDFDELLDECIDRINRGESLDDCLASYPEYAEPLKPLLTTIFDIRAVGSPIPRPAAKAEAKQRFDAALHSMERKRQEHPLTFLNFFRYILGVEKPSQRGAKMRKGLVITAAVALLALLIGSVVNLLPEEEGAPPPVVAQDNFRLLISDDENAIGDFASLNVPITTIQVHSADTGDWIDLTPPADPIDLVQLQGLNAQEIWSGNLDPGQYTMVFLDAGDVTGVLKTGDTVDVKLPSDKLRLNKPFIIEENGDQVTFVFDITVVTAGLSGQYNLNPVMGQSGADQPFHEVGEGELALQIEGDVIPGQSATLLVTLNGIPVQGATVTVNNEELDTTTNENGYVSFVVPDAEELEIRATLNGQEGELKIDLQ